MIAIIGAGGHGKCGYECFYLEGEEVFGFFDDDLNIKGKEVIDGKRVIGLPDEIEDYLQVKSLFLAIGDNRTRLEKYRYYKEKGFRFQNAIHQLAYRSPFTGLGEGIFIMGAAVINPDSKIGNCCIINTSATVDHDCVLEDGVQIGPGVNLAGGVILKEGVFIGIGAKVAPGITIGSWAVIGAGSVVMEDVPEQSFYAGVPAKNKKKSM